MNSKGFSAHATQEYGKGVLPGLMKVLLPHPNRCEEQSECGSMELSCYSFLQGTSPSWLSLGWPGVFPVNLQRASWPRNISVGLWGLNFCHMSCEDMLTSAAVKTSPGDRNNLCKCIIMLASFRKLMFYCQFIASLRLKIGMLKISCFSFNLISRNYFIHDQYEDSEYEISARCCFAVFLLWIWLCFFFPL